MNRNAASPPWEPREYQVGEIVRVNISPECRCWLPRCNGASAPVENGHLARVVGSNHKTKMYSANNFSDHPWYVEFEESFPLSDGYRIGGMWLAGSEMAPLE